MTTMINPYDLMLGNWVLDGDKPIQIFDIRLNMYGNSVPDATDSESWDINLKMADKLNPIPLTPELMGKLEWKSIRLTHDLLVFPGLDFLADHFAAIISLLFVLKDTGPNKAGECWLGARAWKEEKQIHYLHELQNHYRWATGKQLEVTL